VNQIDRLLSGYELRWKTSCTDCCASPCDCNEHVWTYAYDNQGTTEFDKLIGAGERFYTRDEAIKEREVIANCGVSVGPVQRHTGLMQPVVIGHVPAGYECPTAVETIQPQPKPQPKCGLSLCSRPLGGVIANFTAYCSERCCNFDKRRIEAEDRFVVFERAVEDRKASVARSCLGSRKQMRNDFESEIQWAAAQRDAEIARLRAAWNAVQHEPALGDASVFAVIEDDE
jgi:hypothetical protein